MYCANIGAGGHCDYNGIFIKATVNFGNGSTQCLWFYGQKYFKSTIDEEIIVNNDLAVFKKAIQWFDDYFNGLNPEIDFPIKLQGSDFRQKVWELLTEIHYGETMTYGEIADNLGFTEKQVRGWINHNCKNKIRYFNDRYFDKIETPNQAYWLGFIYADGYIVKRESDRNCELGINIQSGDIELLKDFNNELGGVHNITYSHDEKYICNNLKMSITDSVTLRIYSKNIVNDLIKNKVIQNKTQSQIFPVVEDNLFFDFLRGYIDGDGCIYVNQNKISASQVHITSSHDEVLNYIKNKLFLYGISSRVYKEKENKYRIYINHKSALKLLDMIYYDENVQKLNRKYEKYLLLKRLS